MNRFSGNGNGRGRSQQQPQQEEEYQGDDNGNGGREPPAATITLGNLRCVIWANAKGNDGVWYSCTLTRSYKDGQGNWKQATTLGKSDLLLGAELLRLALHKIVELSGGR